MREEMNKIKTEMDDANEQYKKDKGRVSILAVDFIKIAWSSSLEQTLRTEEWMKIIEKKNYESHYPMPPQIQEVYLNHPNAFAIQILGCRTPVNFDYNFDPRFMT